MLKIPNIILRGKNRFIIRLTVQLVGEWHVGAMILDSESEEYDQGENCITMMVRSIDEDQMELSWSTNSSGAASITLRVSQATPAVYLVKTPLGGIKH
jgi:hypothetical protein